MARAALLHVYLSDPYRGAEEVQPGSDGTSRCRHSYRKKESQKTMDTLASGMACTQACTWIIPRWIVIKAVLRHITDSRCGFPDVREEAVGIMQSAIVSNERSQQSDSHTQRSKAVLKGLIIRTLTVFNKTLQC